MSVLDAADITVADLIVLSYHKCAQVFLSLSVNAANIEEACAEWRSAAGEERVALGRKGSWYQLNS